MNEAEEIKWRNVVQQFAQGLEQLDGYHSVKELCRFLLEEGKWQDRDQVIEYLKDYREISLKHHAFHSKWAKVWWNMENIAAYDEKEADEVSKLIAQLEGTSKKG